MKIKSKKVKVLLLKINPWTKDYYDNVENVEMRCGCAPFNRSVQVTTQLARSPNILVIELRRYEAAGNQRKSEKVVKLSENLKLPNGDKFVLQSVINHHGVHTRSGHYTALFLDGEVCYKADDTFVSLVTKNQISTKDNYLLCYIKENDEVQTNSQISITSAPPASVNVKVTCMNCKKKYKHIYLHIKTNAKCAKFYVLDDEKKKYNVYNLAAVKKTQHQKKLQDPIKFNANNLQSQKKRQKRLREEDEEEFKAKNLKSQIKRQRRLKEDDADAFNAKNLQQVKKSLHKKLGDADGRIEHFKSCVMHGAIYPCVCCHRVLFRASVIVLGRVGDGIFGN